MSSKTKQIIAEAQEFLNRHSYDAAHDLEHHQQVWANVQQIIPTISAEIDLFALEIATMWHDAITGKKLINRNKIKRQTANFVARRMSELGFDRKTIVRTKTAILQHSSGDAQTIIESKILADADKLEWLSVGRLKKITQQITDGKFSKFKILIYKYFFKKLFKRIHEKMHFEASQKMLTQKINEFKNNPDVKKIAQKFNSKIEDYI